MCSAAHINGYHLQRSLTVTFAVISTLGKRDLVRVCYALDEYTYQLLAKMSKLFQYGVPKVRVKVSFPGAESVTLPRALG